MFRDNADPELPSEMRRMEIRAAEGRLSASIYEGKYFDDGELIPEPE